MNWYTSRKLIYSGAILFFVIAVTLYFFRDTFFPKPTCFDQKQNGYESGIDCGGTCSLRCIQEVFPLSVLWSRALKTSSTTYDFVAMVSNKNIDNAPKEIGYVFMAYNDQGGVFATIKGTTTAPIDSNFPIILQNIYLSEEPKELVAELIDGPHYLVSEKPTSPTLRSTDISFEAGAIPRVYVKIINNKLINISNLVVRTVLYDTNDNAFGVGETIIPFLGKQESKNISFTWDTAFTEKPTKIRVYPIFDPFLSGKK